MLNLLDLHINVNLVSVTASIVSIFFGFIFPECFSCCFLCWPQFSRLNNNLETSSFGARSLHETKLGYKRKFQYAFALCGALGSWLVGWLEEGDLVHILRTYELCGLSQIDILL